MLFCCDFRLDYSQGEPLTHVDSHTIAEYTGLNFGNLINRSIERLSVTSLTKDQKENNKYTLKEIKTEKKKKFSTFINI